MKMCDDGNINDPFETLFKMSSVSSHQNPISELDYDNGPLFFDEDHELPLSQILSQYDQTNQNHSAAHNVDENSIDPPKEEETKITDTNANCSKSNGKGAVQQQINNGALRRRNLAEIPWKRTCKKDRHSKIRTAQGVRDRRMRLSLQIARQFFDLQDLLGHDKASNTIEWLLNKSRNAIEELIKDQVMPSIEDTKLSNDVSEKSRTLQKDEKIKLQKRVSKANMREAREKARTRARCRTREKMMMKNTEDSTHVLCKSSSNDLDLDNLGSSSGTYQDPAGSQNHPNVDDFPLLEQELFDVSIVEKLLGLN